MIAELRNDFDYVICDSPAGIERGAFLAMYFADEAIVVSNPEVSSVRDADRMIGLLTSKSRKAEQGESVPQHLLLTRYDGERVEKGEMLKVEDVQDILAVPLLGIVPECPSVLQASNIGQPVILDDKSIAGRAYAEAVARLLGEDVPVTVPRAAKRGIIDRLLRRSA